MVTLRVLRSLPTSPGLGGGLTVASVREQICENVAQQTLVCLDLGRLQLIEVIVQDFCR
jgi:hypothetical protein